VTLRLWRRFIIALLVVTMLAPASAYADPLDRAFCNLAALELRDDSHALLDYLGSLMQEDMAITDEQTRRGQPKGDYLDPDLMTRLKENQAREHQMPKEGIALDQRFAAFFAGCAGDVEWQTLKEMHDLRGGLGALIPPPAE
jgi:hypothetical protein